MEAFRVKIVTTRFVCSSIVFAQHDRQALEKATTALIQHTTNFVQTKDPKATIPNEAYKIVDASMERLNMDVFQFNWDLRLKPTLTNEGNCED